MLKDVSSFFSFFFFCSTVCVCVLCRAPALMSRMCHCQPQDPVTAARDDQNGTSSRSVSPAPPRELCSATVPLSLTGPLVALRVSPGAVVLGHKKKEKQQKKVFIVSVSTLNVCTKSHFTPCHNNLDPLLCWAHFSGGASQF